ncbi:hypothetical protein QBC39DRAFT_331757 [Podospora conica]|nr:hypothetical protein QBC39DRAFT_331757 [Schizothecium conicum]
MSNGKGGYKRLNSESGSRPSSSRSNAPSTTRPLTSGSATSGDSYHRPISTFNGAYVARVSDSASYSPAPYEQNPSAPSQYHPDSQDANQWGYQAPSPSYVSSQEYPGCYNENQSASRQYSNTSGHRPLLPGQHESSGAPATGFLGNLPFLGSTRPSEGHAPQTSSSYSQPRPDSRDSQYTGSSANRHRQPAARTAAAPSAATRGQGQGRGSSSGGGSSGGGGSLRSMIRDIVSPNRKHRDSKKSRK